MKITLCLKYAGEGCPAEGNSLFSMDVADAPSVATLGLSPAEGKALLARLQTEVVSMQLQAISARQRVCEYCLVFRV